jgi:hypothetical protein
MRGKEKNKKVIVAMSGGIDSSVAAALLKKDNFDVIGVFMKFWKAPDKDGLVNGWNKCCSSESEVRARKVAKILKIPFYIFNFEKEFKKRVVDYFLNENKKGLTPNPCVVCNKEIKFGLLLERALKLKADYIATGHYARLREDRSRQTYKLHKGRDKEKDQSYFLWKLNQKQLKHILFPIGNLTRKEVEKLARKFKLPFSGVKKSQEICWARLEDWYKQGYSFNCVATSLTNMWRMDNDPPFLPLADFVATWTRLNLQPTLRLTTAAEAMKRMRYDAACVGDDEFFLGLDFFLAIAGAPPCDLLSEGFGRPSDILQWMRGVLVHTADPGGTAQVPGR